MKKILYISVLLTLTLFNPLLCHSQNATAEHIYLTPTSLTSIDLTSKKLAGSSYINKKFLPAKISNQNTIYLMRYNAYLDEIEVQLSGKEYYLPKLNNYSVTFVGSNKTYLISNYKEKEITQRGFFIAAHRGKEYVLLLKEKIKLYEEVPPKLGFTKYEPPTLKRVKNVFYFSYRNSLFEELPKKKKLILKLFNKKSKKIQGYAKENKYKFKKEKDLIELFKYYNSLE